MRRIVVVLTAGLSLGGCGDVSADLFSVIRSGAGPGAAFTMVLRDDGTVTCNGKRQLLPGELLLSARALAREIIQPATSGVRLPSGPRPVLIYVVRTPSGEFSFADDSPRAPPAFERIAALTRTVAKQVCHLPR